MEAVGAIVGLVTLAGQCSSRVQTLIEYCNAVQETSRDAELMQRDLNSLLMAVHLVQGMVETMQVRSLNSGDNLALSALRNQLSYCDKDVGFWLSTARKCYCPSGTSSSAKSWFSRFLKAVNKTSVREVRAEIETHSNRLCLPVSVLTATNSYCTQEALGRIGTLSHGIAGDMGSPSRLNDTEQLDEGLGDDGTTLVEHDATSQAQFSLGHAEDDASQRFQDQFEVDAVCVPIPSLQPTLWETARGRGNPCHFCGQRFGNLDGSGNMFDHLTWGHRCLSSYTENGVLGAWAKLDNQVRV